MELALRRVRDEVLKATHNRQEPFKYGSLGGAEIPLVAAVDAAPPSVQPKMMYSRFEIAQFCQSVATNPSIPALEQMLERFKDPNIKEPILGANRSTNYNMLALPCAFLKPARAQ